MRVRLLVNRVGAGFVQSIGDTVNVSTDEAERLFAQGAAEPLRSAVPETAAVAPTDNAMRTHGKPRPRGQRST